MLVLFVLTIALLHNKIVEIKQLYETVLVQKEEYEKVLQLEKQFESLENNSSLQYIEDKRIFVPKRLMGIEIFSSDSVVIKNELLPKIDSVGDEIMGILKELHDTNPDLKFQLVIEGTAAIPWRKLVDGSYNPDNPQMYDLSYRRALSLYFRWKQKHNFRRYNTEVIIAGSGFNGINRDDSKEDNNKRFFIQIIPKPQKITKKE